MDPTFKGLGPPLPQKRPASGPSFKLIFIIIGGALVLLTALVLIGNALGSSTQNNAQRLIYRLDSLKTLTTTASKDISDEALSSANSSFSLVLSGDISAIKEVIKEKKADKALSDIKKDESNDETLTRLNSAKTNGTYDSTYRTVLREKLQAAYNLAEEVSKRTTKQQKEALSALQEHLSTYYEQLAVKP